MVDLDFVILNENDYKLALIELDNVFNVTDEESYEFELLKHLCDQIVTYEAIHYPIPDFKFYQHENLKYLVKESNISLTELEELLSTNDSHVCELLNGSVELTSVEIDILSKRFCINPDYFKK